MDPKVLYWTGALLNMGVIVALVGVGVLSIRRGKVVRHRRAMLSAIALVGAFILSYLVKLAVLGREDLSIWSPAAINTLRFHETCVLAMVVGGALAGARAWRMRRSRNVTRDPADAPAPATVVRWHRRAGWTAVVGAALGFVSAAFVLLGMYARA